MVAALFDWLEYHEKCAASAVVGFARVAGIAVAMVTNQRLALGGALTAGKSVMKPSISIWTWPSWNAW